MKGYPLRFWLLKAGCLCYLLAAYPTAAQIVPDATLPVNSSVTSSGDTSVIEGGTVAGSNLFHSFNEFSIPAGSIAKFNNALDMQNIFTRVTGGKISNIDGLIKANSIANLFLLNPNGIIFGSNARLEIGGSFFASTANSINFADGFQFSATNPQAPPLLTVNVPIGLQFGSNPGNIVNSSSVTNSSGGIVGLQVQTGKTLGLVGGEVAIAQGHLTAYNGRVELGSVAANNTVSLTPTNSGWLLGYQGISNFGDIRLDAAKIAVGGDGRGSVAINAKNIDISFESNLEAGISSASQFLGTGAGDITLNANDVVSIDNSTITNEVLGSGNSGDININARSLFFTDNAQLSTNSKGQGNAGNITINALDTVSLSGLGNNGETEIAANLEGTGKGGKITVNAPRVSLLNGATIVAHTFGQGDAGSIEIDATDSILIDGVGDNKLGSGVGSQVFDKAKGNGGAIALNAPRVNISGGAIIAAHTSGQGNAGSIEINANQVFLDGVGSNGESSGLGSAAFETARGNAGQIVIKTDSLDVTNGASLFVASSGGDAGSVRIKALGAVTFDGVGSNGRFSNAFSAIEQKATGNGKEINITANSLSVSNGAVISARTAAQGDGGNITIEVNSLSVLNGGQIRTTSRAGGNAGNIRVNATESITFRGSDSISPDRLAQIGRLTVGNQGADTGLFADTDANSTGAGGNINVTTRSLFLGNGAEVNVSTLGQGDSGNVAINVADSLVLDRSAIAAKSPSGRGGNINLQVSDTLNLRNNSTVSTEAGNEQSGGGNGGNININTALLVPVEKSSINANAFQGRGGRIRITTQGIFRSPDSPITASSQRGINGIVQYDTPQENPSQGMVELPSKIVNPADLIANSCIARRSGQQGSFIMTGAGGLPTLPDDMANSVFGTYTIPSKLEAEESRGGRGSRGRWGEFRIPNLDMVEADGIYSTASGQLALGRECP